MEEKQRDRSRKENEGLIKATWSWHGRSFFEILFAQFFQDKGSFGGAPTGSSHTAGCAACQDVWVVKMERAVTLLSNGEVFSQKVMFLVLRSGLCGANKVTQSPPTLSSHLPSFCYFLCFIQKLQPSKCVTRAFWVCFGPAHIFMTVMPGRNLKCFVFSRDQWVHWDRARSWDEISQFGRTRH